MVISAVTYTFPRLTRYRVLSAYWFLSMVAPTGSVKIQFFFHMYMERQFFMFSRDATHLSDFNFGSFIFLSTLLCVSICTKDWTGKGKTSINQFPFKQAVLSRCTKGRVLTLSSFYMHLACSLDLNKAELMLWIQKYVHIFSHSMEQPWFSYYFLHCFQLQLWGFLPGTERLLLIP